MRWVGSAACDVDVHGEDVSCCGWLQLNEHGSRGMVLYAEAV